MGIRIHCSGRNMQNWILCPTHMNLAQLGDVGDIYSVENRRHKCSVLLVTGDIPHTVTTREDKAR